MCLAIPGKIQQIDGQTATIDFDGVIREASLAVLPNAKIGDYVLVHAGFAIETMSNDEAEKTLSILGDLS